MLNNDYANISNINDISEIKAGLNKQENKFLDLNFAYNDFYMCPNCKETPIIEFENNNFEGLSQICSCGKRQLFNESEEIQENENNISEIDEASEFIQKNKICSEHNDIFSFYCETCKIDICKICNNQHNGHTIIEFDKDNLEVKRKIDYFEDIFRLNKNYEEKDDEEDEEGQLFDLEFNNRDKLIYLISLIINNYYNYPNYNIIRNINNIYDSLSYYIKTHPKDNNLKNALNVNSPTEFYELIKNEDNRLIIKSIVIIGMNFYNLDKFNGIELNNLTILDLRRNNIKNISWLANAKLLNLEKIDLGMNELGDDMIEYIGIFQFPKLTYLNFYNNYFTDYNIFKAVDISHFGELKELSVSSNRFNYDISKINIKNTKFDLRKLEKIHFNNGVFSDDSSKLLNCFNFFNAKKIFLTSNNFTNIDFIENMKLPNLYRLCLNNNKISSVKKLDCLKKNSPHLKIIELKNNWLEDIREIEELILNWDLNEFNITGNKIDLNKTNNFI